MEYFNPSFPDFQIQPPEVGVIIGRPSLRKSYEAVDNMMMKKMNMKIFSLFKYLQ